ncbi:hypothetical protein JLBYU40_69 [Escherichia phage JLBYU40]|uniref:Uncharacterized protein n=1 Tax=Escherichia phage JLBYU40 TaxID=2894749 RepID=A0AAE9CFP0_9CAUD|nr:hypothetical protein JLBYU40_69 [Escherichia phage JLBYU40]
MFKLLVVIWYSQSNRANTSHVIDFNTKNEAEKAYTNLIERNKESRSIVYEVTKLY